MKRLEVITLDNAYKIMQNFEKLYAIMGDTVEELKQPRKRPPKAKAEPCQRMNYHIYWVICWTLHVTRKSWGCLKEYVEDISMYIRVVLNFILKHIEKCGKMREMLRK